MDVSIDNSSVGGGAPSGVQSLPPEVLYAIFKNLRMPDLASVRQTCPQWYDIVTNNRSLMNRFVLSLRSTLIYEGCTECTMLMNTRSTFEKVCLKACEIRWSPSLWWSVGNHVVELTLNDCVVYDVETLINMMRCTRTTLRSLTLKSIKFLTYSIDKVPFDFRMERLHSLTFRSSFVYDELFRAFKQISPNLKTLKLTFSSYEHWGEQLVDFVAHHRTTLEAITLSYTKVNSAILQQIGRIETLRLRKVSLKSCYELKERDILELARAQPSIVHLNLDNIFSANEQFLRALSAFLPQMKRIKLRVARIMNLHLSFLAHLKQLNYLKITDSTHVKGNLDLSAYENPALEKLYVSAATFSRNILPRFFERCPNIRSLTLYQCTYENIHDLQLAFSHLKGLEYLNLQRTFDIGDSFFNRDVFDTVVMPFERIRFYPIANLRKLCYLNLSHCRDLSDQTLMALSFPLLKKIDLRGLHITEAGIESMVRECPLLEYVLVDACKRICDNAVLFLCRDLKGLRLLNLEGCKAITDLSVEHIMRYCRSLVWLNVLNCPQLTVEAKKRLSTLRSLRSLHEHVET
ncbi:F-box and leucine-rich repeat protein 13-like [Anopheles ziemanni]|uniref:F-box and leucine-rich repeat protein 13-like n=1 Tax=Anopheles coustani TaxID=139045 RepID=UPI00265855AD|nr:F-box and leucine-rich repeat protein 13-like [Anopheles coustani]XP_058178961.1 F-box and leucine-rich repeat protein 13-like [Anopheles ziemanni]